MYILLLLKMLLVTLVLFLFYLPFIPPFHPVCTFFPLQPSFHGQSLKLLLMNTVLSHSHSITPR